LEPTSDGRAAAAGSHPEPREDELTTGPAFARQRLLLARVIALLVALVVVPVVITLGSLSGEQPVREGEPAPRTILAEEAVRVVDEEATERARQSAAESVEAVLVYDAEAQRAIVSDVREVFVSTRAVRAAATTDTSEPDADGRTTRPTPAAQRDQLTESLPELPEEVVGALVALSDGDLEIVERETVAIAQQLARQRIEPDEVEERLAVDLPVELALRSLPGDTGTTVVTPVLETKMGPTVTVDLDTTAADRTRAADAVADVASSWLPGQEIVREGQLVGPLEYLAIEQLRVGGTSAWLTLGRALLSMLVVTAVGAVYLQRMQPRVWVDPRKLVLLGLLTTAYAALTVGSAVLVEATSSGWAYAVPAGAYAMLAALLIHPVVGIATMLPAAIIVLLVIPSSAAVAVFAAAAVLTSVPLTTRIASRSDLRSATLRAGVSYPILAAAVVLVFGMVEQVPIALAAGALNGALTAVVVQGALPFLETLFRLPTVTALLDLNARDHPLLRELEAKALGTYNHSVMVASLAERACRAVGANPLLGSVAALYHDIGKVRHPHFFIENQQGIANPHDELEPAVSATVIQNHISDGVELATEYRLPPEVVECIGSHHGTMVVGYFYERALRAAGGDRSAVAEEHFRYRGSKPRSKEAAILVLADCSEATTRAMAMSRGTLPREEIEATVDRLLAERIDDGQFDTCDLTFRELYIARDTIVESLVGIYHPRIAYPSRSGGDDDAEAGRTPTELTQAGDPAPGMIADPPDASPSRTSPPASVHAADGGHGDPPSERGAPVSRAGHSSGS
jgi:cyclic-di-AMP phosphodiesterase PgpH